MWGTRRGDKDHQMATDYLLGRLSELERQKIAERYFVEDDFFDQLLEAENDLFDRYVRGQLTDDERVAFKNYLEKLPDGAHKIAVATTLMEVAEERALSAVNREVAAPASRWPSLPDLISVPGRMFQYVLAATASVPGRLFQYGLAATAIALLAGAVWLFTESWRLRLENERLRSELAQRDTGQEVARQRMQTLESLVAEQQKRTDQLLGELEKEKERAAGQAQEIARLQSLPSPIISLFLTSASRDFSAPDTLFLKDDTKYVTLTVRIRGDELYTGRPAVFQTAEGGQVQPLAGRQIRSPKLGKAVVFRLDAGKLTQTTYKLTLTLKAKDGLEISPDYYFTVVRR
jgi:hypothetical protein